MANGWALPDWLPARHTFTRMDPRCWLWCVILTTLHHTPCGYAALRTRKRLTGSRHCTLLNDTEHWTSDVACRPDETLPTIGFAVTTTTGPAANLRYIVPSSQLVSQPTGTPAKVDGRITVTPAPALRYPAHCYQASTPLPAPTPLHTCHRRVHFPVPYPLPTPIVVHGATTAAARADGGVMPLRSVIWYQCLDVIDSWMGWAFLARPCLTTPHLFSPFGTLWACR